MIKSMTGYGSAKGNSGKLEITVELRSVNNRFLDCSIRLPRVYNVLEESIKSRIQSTISRGKVDVFVTIDSSKADDILITVNTSVADAYVSAFNSLAERYGIINDVTALGLSRMPDVLSVSKEEADIDQLREDVQKILGEAVVDFDSMRVREGERLYSDVCSHIDRIEDLVLKVEERSPLVVSEYRHRLEAKMTEVLENTKYDEARILTEVAIFADRVAVDEETVRLRSHISQFREMLESEEPVGRKMDFLVQELNREANTIGSKCNDLITSKLVVDLKAEIEKIREQIQNIE